MAHASESFDRPLSAELRVLSPELRIPEIGTVNTDEYERRFVIESTVQAGETALPCLLTFERFKDYPSDRTAPYQRAQLHLDLYDPEGRTKIGTYKGALVVERSRAESPIDDGKVHSYWRIYTRRIDERVRGLGLGSAGLQAFEEATQRMAKAHPVLQTEWIEMLTSLSSLTRMAISQPWLAQHGLAAYQKASGPDFGYLPHDKDVYSVGTILRAGKSALQDVRSSDELPQICLYKPL